MRQVRIGYQQLRIRDPEPSLDVQQFQPLREPSQPIDVVLTQALGWEAHMMIRYNVHFDPARSHLFASLLYEGGDYELEERILIGNTGSATDASPSTFQGHVFWLRFGMQVNRPSYQMAPFVSLPIIARKKGREFGRE